MDKYKIFFVFGTRPEAIKMVPIIKKIEKDSRFEYKVILSGQHREMVDSILKFFQIKVDYDLNVMIQNQTLSYITSTIISKLENIFIKDIPDMVLVHGDTTTACATSLAAFYHKISIGHIEAGLRTGNKYSPFPEEMNRQLVDKMSDLYFAPTDQSKANLLRENYAESKIYVTGNTAIDVLRYTINDSYRHPLFTDNNKIILVTMHRRENLGKGMFNVFSALKKIALNYPNVKIVFPVHKNPQVRDIAYEQLKNIENIYLIEPLDVFDFHNFCAKAYLILTDSGGVQEEAPSLGIPVLVLRDTTERPEGVQSGNLQLIGTKEKRVYEAVSLLLNDNTEYYKMSCVKNPYGDGHASERILEIIYNYLKR
ncbi:non-hydrolyzing UDP-N-acetylglucosamine 2-epimerase [Enterococcus faecalis]|uniref:non-hydrolyzing UDP-N-acetylglucosamine 2-epimerase n=1 Tax=Enterococcus faecalis TaxID=1351 RepID=UPI002DB5608A|nr:UDP-N-acetylglucosamine 2-epimerase (non-hydrolyzing) [Enterococcus faecalis]